MTQDEARTHWRALQCAQEALRVLEQSRAELADVGQALVLAMGEHWTGSPVQAARQLLNERERLRNELDAAISYGQERTSLLDEIELRCTQARLASSIGKKKDRTEFLLSELERIAQACTVRDGGENYTFPDCKAVFARDECHCRPELIGPAECGPYVQCPKCNNEFQKPA